MDPLLYFRVGVPQPGGPNHRNCIRFALQQSGYDLLLVRSNRSCRGLEPDIGTVENRRKGMPPSLLLSFPGDLDELVLHRIRYAVNVQYVMQIARRGTTMTCF